MVDYTKKLGRAIASGTNSTNDLKEEIVPDDTSQNLILAPYDRVRVRVMAVFTKKFYAENSFILDHPVYGELDSSTLKLDGGYREESFSFAGEFPLEFTGGDDTVYTYYDKN